jgi:hypothetical protein
MFSWDGDHYGSLVVAIDYNTTQDEATLTAGKGS